VICCALGYGLPDISGDYENATHPYAMQFLLPITHIAVMSSVYTTILISFERYVRVRTSATRLAKKNIRILFVICKNLFECLFVQLV
jgi:hypothetical protein